MNKNYASKRKKQDVKSRVISRQIDRINDLEKTISELEISNSEKDELINSIDYMRNDLLEIVNELKQQSEEYNRLISELMEMKKAMNQIVFNKKWKLIRWLLK